MLFSLAGERERGTWRQVLSTGVSVRHVACGKAAGVALPLLVVLVPAAALGSAALLLTTPQTTAHIAARLALMTAAYVAFFGVYVGTVLIASSLAATARQALLVLLTFWFVTTLMLPFVALAIGRAWHPSPTSFQFAAEILNAKQAVHYPTAREIEAELLTTYRVKTVAELPVDPTGIHLLRQMAIDDRIYNAALGRLHDSYRLQEAVLNSASIMSPLLAVQALSMGLSGTDLETHLHFSEYTAGYRHLMETVLNNDAAYNLTPGPRDRELWEQIPPLAYQGRPFVAVLRGIGRPALCLSVWVVLVALGCVRLLPSVGP